MLYLWLKLLKIFCPPLVCYAPGTDFFFAPNEKNPVHCADAYNLGIQEIN